MYEHELFTSAEVGDLNEQRRQRDARMRERNHGVMPGRKGGSLGMGDLLPDGMMQEGMEDTYVQQGLFDTDEDDDGENDNDEEEDSDEEVPHQAAHGQRV